jgi:hypothetical protein
MVLKIDSFYESRDMQAPVKFRGYDKEGYLFDRYHQHTDDKMRWKHTDRMRLAFDRHDTARIIRNLKAIPPPC